MADSKLPFTITSRSEEELASRKARGILKLAESVRVSPGNILLPARYTEMATKLYNFEFRSDDVLIVSFPKSGSTWMREIVWGFKNLNQLHLADEQLLYSRTYSLTIDMEEENSGVVYEEWLRRLKEECAHPRLDEGLVMQLAHAHRGSPRVMFASIPIMLFNPSLLDTCKVIYVARNPKDLCVSSHNFYTALGRISCDLETYAELFMEDELFPGSYWHHIQQAWRLRNHPNLYFVFYEDLKADTMKELVQLNHFLDLNLTQEQLESVAEHASYKKMKARESKLPILELTPGKSFYSGGRVGGWGSVASKELNAKMDAWIAENSKEIDVKFRYA